MSHCFDGWIPAHMLPLPNNPTHGEVLAVNSAGVYLRFDQMIFLLCDQQWGIAPISIIVDKFDETKRLLSLKQGDAVVLSDKSLLFSNGRLNLQTVSVPQESDSTPAPLFDCVLEAAETLSSLNKYRGLSMLVQPLVLGHTYENSKATNPYYAHALKYFCNLIDAIRHSEKDSICHCVEKLLGLGPGLTPSADDIMLGMLYVFRKFPLKFPVAIRILQDAILQKCDNHTNIVSAAYLKAIIRGAYFERMEQVFQGLCGRKHLDISLLTQIGSNSGSEMLLGMLVAVSLCGCTPISQTL